MPASAVNKMNTLDDLKRKLSRTNARAFEGLTFDHAPLAKELEILTQWVGATASPSPPFDIVLEALLRFQRSSHLASLREAQLVCYGCIQAYGQEKRPLIEDSRLFPELLECADKYRQKPRAFRRCYRGLLSGYLDYDPDVSSSGHVGKQNWKTLQNYLHERLRNINSASLEPDWVNAIIEHKNLLTDDPTGRYGQSLLEGDRQEFEAAKLKLDISNTSWVIRQLVFAQLDAAIAQNDLGFNQHLPRLLELLEEHRLILDKGLQMVLERYRGCADAVQNIPLRNFAIAHWGNPWLPSNSARWSRVTETTRQMVTDWLKLDLIRQFFSLLAEDNANDKRRLKFWERFHKSIDDMYFALGSYARANQSRDFVELRKKMQGRVLDLNAGGSPRNNAFIMRMGDYVSVEFGVSGNAFFIFDRRHLPFDLEKRTIAGDRSELKHDRNVERLLHIDTGAGRWEHTFEQTLLRLMNARPADEDTARHTAPRARLVERPGSDAARATRTSNHPSYSRRELEQYCTVHGLRIRDLTSQRGNLWVRTDQSDRSVSRQLSDWGFQYKENKGWWRQNP
jgi:hypothetical protein